jgi:hypothetical protein
MTQLENFLVLCVRGDPGAGIGGPKGTVFRVKNGRFWTFFFCCTTGSPFEVPVAKLLCKSVLGTVLCIFGSGEGFSFFSVFLVFFACAWFLGRLTPCSVFRLVLGQKGVFYRVVPGQVQKSAKDQIIFQNFFFTGIQIWCS